MKKFLALVLCLLMAFSMTAAVAEEGALQTIDDMYEGVWVQFEDGFEIYLPADWYEIETTEEWHAKGIFYAAGTEDLSRVCTLAWQPLEAEYTIEQVHAELVAVYPDASLVNVNGVGLVAYVDAENNLMTCIALDAAEPGYYMFAFSPADDVEFQTLASLIASSIRNF